MSSDLLPSAAELRYFVEVAHTSNVSRAAERLGVSQPSLSLAIQRLEKSFGVPLLIRSKSGVKLTKAGDKLLVQARSLLHEWEKIRGEALKDDHEVRGRYILGSHPAVALYSFSRFLPELLRKHPGLEISMVHGLSREITEEVISFKVDFGIVMNPISHPDLVIRNLCQDEVVLWTGPGKSPLQDPASGEAVLICDTNLAQTQFLLAQIRKQGLHFKRVLTSTDIEVVASLTAAGAGIGILPHRVATRIADYKLRRLERHNLKFTDRLCLIFRSDAQRSKASRTITQAIEKALASGK